MSAFANGGMRSDPVYVTAIADANGNIISDFAPSQTEVITRKGYYRILSVLLNVVDGISFTDTSRGPRAILFTAGNRLVMP